MLQKRVRDRIKGLRNDNRSGAADLTQGAIEIFQQYLRTTRVKEKTEFLQDVRELCKAVMFAQVSMSSIKNTCIDVLSTLTKYRDGDNLQNVRRELERKLSKLSSQIANAPLRIASHLSKFIRDNARIITISYSSTVAGVLSELKRRGKMFEVIVMESRPMFEGRRTATELARARVPTTLIADAALGEYSKIVDLAVVGADTIFYDGSIVNKIGTFPVAVCCKEARKPFYVLAHSSKLNFESPRLFVPQVEKPTELLKTSPRGLLVKNIYFELTPPKYLTAIITEAGVFSPSALRQISKH